MEILRLIWPLLVIELILKAVAFRDLSSRESREIKWGNKWIWAAVILFVSTLGPVTYLVWGRNGAE